MVRLTKRVAVALFVIGLVSFFGPILVAAIATTVAINAPEDPWPTRTEGDRLVSAYRDHEKNPAILSSHFAPPDGEECGYEPSELFPKSGFIEAAKEQKFTHYWGYFILDRWRGDFEWEAFNSRISLELDESVSQFQLGFLRRCITTTLARDICMSQVEELIHSSADNITRNYEGTESIHPGTTNDVVCLYADGVAARIGIPLQSKDQK